MQHRVEKRVGVSGLVLLTVLSAWILTASSALAGPWCGIGLYYNQARPMTYVDANDRFKIQWQITETNCWDENHMPIRTLESMAIQDNGYVVMVSYVNYDGNSYRALGKAQHRLIPALRNAYDNLKERKPPMRAGSTDHYNKLYVTWVRSGETTQVSATDIERGRHQLGLNITSPPKVTIKEKHGEAEIYFVQLASEVAPQSFEGIWRFDGRYSGVAWPSSCGAMSQTIRLQREDGKIGVYRVGRTGQTLDRLFSIPLQFEAVYERDNPGRPLQYYLRKGQCDYDRTIDVQIWPDGKAITFGGFFRYTWRSP